MELPKAVTLLTQAIAGFHEAVGQTDKLEMAEVVGTLRRVIPNLLADDEDRNSFLQFIGVVQNDVIAAAHHVLGACTPAPASCLLCLNNGTGVSCDGPPNRLSRCDLCNRTGKM